MGVRKEGSGDPWEQLRGPETSEAARTGKKEKLGGRRLKRVTQERRAAKRSKKVCSGAHGRPRDTERGSPQ